LRKQRQSRRRRPTHRLVVVLGELAQTTAGKWIAHPPTRCPNGHSLARCSSVKWVSKVAAMAATSLVLVVRM